VKSPQETKLPVCGKPTRRKIKRGGEVDSSEENIKLPLESSEKNV